MATNQTDDELKEGTLLSVSHEGHGDILRRRAEDLKEKGNAEYNKKAFKDAVDLYTHGINVACKDVELNSILYTNRAAAHYYLGRYQDTVNDAKAARELQPRYMKAIIRGVLALLELRNFEEAAIWCDQGLEIDHQNKRLLELKSKCPIERQKEREGKKAPQEVNNESATQSSEEKMGDSRNRRKKAPFSGDLEQAIPHYQMCLQEAKDVGDRAAEGRAYADLGIAYGKLGDYKQAIKFHGLQLNIAKEMAHKAMEGTAYIYLANAYGHLSKYKETVKCSELGLRIAKEIGDRASEGRMHGFLGVTFSSLGDFEEAIAHHNLHLQIAKERGDRLGECGAYGNLGAVYIKTGDFGKAIDCYTLQLQIAKEEEDRANEGQAYCGLGCAYHGSGDCKTAIRYHELRLALSKETGDLLNEGTTYSNLGNVYCDLGDYHQAIDFFNRHLKINQKVGNKAGEMTSYNNLGRVNQKFGRFDEAEKHYSSSLRISKLVGDKAAEGRIYGNLGNTSLRLHKYKEAIEYYQLNLKIAQEVGDKSDEGRAYNNLGNGYWILQDFAQAIEYHGKQLQISKEIGNRYEEGAAYYNLGSVYLSMGDFEQAIKNHELALIICKDVGDRVGFAKAVFQLGSSYKHQGNLEEAALRYTEAIKELEDIRSQLLSKDEWKISLRNEYHMMYQHLQSLLLKQGKVNEALFVTEKGRAQALEELMMSQYGVTPVHSEGEELNPTALQTYTKSVAVLYLAVYRNEIRSWFLQEGEEARFAIKKIDSQQFNCEEFSDLQSFIQRTISKLCNLDGQECEDQGFKNGDLRILYDITVGTVVDLIRGNDLIIVPDGPLFLAPFAAFLSPQSRYLCKDLRIRVVPSLTSLKLITDSPPSYHSSRGALIVGDPYLAKVVKSKRKKEPRFKPLLGAKEEAKMIAEMLQTTPLIGEKATKKEVLNRLNSVALVHIAAHGDSDRGEIALAPEPDIDDPMEEDYRLTVAEVLSVRLRARLVVLSCCHSGRGEIKAEGVVGIARAFLGAGARSVLVALWALKDESALEFMRRFYEQLVSGNSASEALHQAMKCQRESQKFSAVKDWASFVLIGDDVTLDFGQIEGEKQSNE